MKRTVSVLIAAVTMLALAGALCGCSALGSTTYTPSKKTAQVSTPAIGQAGVLRVGVNSSNTPFSTQVSGKIVGLDVDIAAALADEMGLNLEMVDVGSDPESALKDGSVDIVMCMDKNDNASSCWLSDTYVQTAVALFATSSSAALPTASSSPSIEAQSASMSAWEVTNQFGDTALKSATDLKTAFSDLKSGQTTYVAADAVIGSYVSYTSKTNAQIVGLMQKVSGYSIGVTSTNTDLKTAVANALSTITKNGTTGVIESKWLGHELDLSSVKVTDTAGKSSTSTSSSTSASTSTSTSTSNVGSNAVSISTSKTTSATN